MNADGPQTQLDGVGHHVVGHEPAHRVRAKVPALVQVADGILLIGRDAGAFRLPGDIRLFQ